MVTARLVCHQQAFQEVVQRLSSHEHVHLVVATRARTPGLQRLMHAGAVVVLEQLSEADGLQLLDSRLPEDRHCAADGKDRDAAQQLVQLVQSNPLTLAVAAGLVNIGRHTWQVRPVLETARAMSHEPQCSLPAKAESCPVVACARGIRAQLHHVLLFWVTRCGASLCGRCLVLSANLEHFSLHAVNVWASTRPLPWTSTVFGSS